MEQSVFPFPRLHLLRPQRIEPLKVLAALIDPIVVLVRGDLAPVFDAGDGTRLAQETQLFFALQVVADVAVEDAAALMRSIRVAYQHGDGHGRPGALAEHLAALAAGALALRPLIPPQVQDVDGAELLRQTGPHPGIHVAIDPRTVADEGHHTLFADAV